MTWPGEADTKSFIKTDNFMAKYFISCCPYLYGSIEVNYDPGEDWLYVHTDDDDCFPLNLIWIPGPADEDGLWW